MHFLFKNGWRRRAQRWKLILTVFTRAYFWSNQFFSIVLPHKKIFWILFLIDFCNLNYFTGAILCLISVILLLRVIHFVYNITICFSLKRLVWFTYMLLLFVKVQFILILLVKQNRLSIFSSNKLVIFFHLFIRFIFSLWMDLLKRS